MMRGFRILALLLVGLTLFAVPAWGQGRGIDVEGKALAEMQGERRVALVIGNSDYETGRLRNPKNDARDIAEALKATGFEVTLLQNAGYRAMRRGVIAFGRKLKQGGVGLFYYAGHGVQVRGANYMIPLNSEIEAEEEVPVEALDVNQVLARMDGAKNRLNIVILDACRNNPFARAFRSPSQGLAQTMAPSGTFIAYATAPGAIAIDGKGHNSPFTQALVRTIRNKPGKLEDVFKQVRLEVRRASEGKQTPWTSSSITGDFYFRLPEGGVAGSASVTRTAEIVFWESIKDSGQVADFEAYLEQFPNGAFAALARNRLHKLQQVAAVSTPAKPELVLEPVEAVYIATKNANIRTEPTVSSAKVTTLPAGTELYVPGKTPDGKWLKVEHDGKGLGYIYAPLLQEKEAWETAKRQAEAERKAAEDAVRQAEEVARRQAEAEARRRAERQRLASVTPPKPAGRAETTPAVGTYSKGHQPGDAFKDCPKCPEMVVVPAGSFTMGSPSSEKGRYKDEGPQHRVTIRQAFAVGKFEVTFDEWDACVSGGSCNGYRPEDRGWGRGRRPVINVGWKDAKAYVDWLSRKTGKSYRLLTESEWEYAARAGTTTRYHWGDGYDSGKVAGGGKTESVGRYPANRFGIHDFHGNVWEWVEDCYKDSYSGAPSDGSAWTRSACGRRVLRGGSWSNDPGGLRSANRYWDGTGYRYFDGVGFRVARTL
jgi:formylglycine-generating enzyme required for sulfatase activity